METLNNEKTYDYYMVNGGISQIRLNLEMNIYTRFQKRTSKVLHKNIIGEKECIHDDLHEMITEINEKLKKEDLELVHYNIDKIKF